MGSIDRLCGEEEFWMRWLRHRRAAEWSSCMSQLTIPIPLSVTEDEARLYLAIKLFEVGRLSCGEAAELAGYSKRTFMELLGKHGVAFMAYPAQELQDD